VFRKRVCRRLAKIRISGDLIMTKLLVGFILGIVVATVGFSGIAKMLDKSVDKVKEVTIEQAK
jgi:hypothetical protein